MMCRGIRYMTNYICLRKQKKNHVSFARTCLNAHTNTLNAPISKPRVLRPTSHRQQLALIRDRRSFRDVEPLMPNSNVSHLRQMC